MGPSPRIVRKSLLTGARQAEGVAVVIDVLRAFTCAAFMAHLGAEKIVLLAEPEAVLKLKRDEGCLAVGEERDLFDFVLVATLENGRMVAQSIDVPAEQPA
jgi:phosphosulfolactate phosphohydrolase-like enzyme